MITQSWYRRKAYEKKQFLNSQYPNMRSFRILICLKGNRWVQCTMKMCLKQARWKRSATCDLLCNTALTYRSQERIKEVLCATPEVHVVGQLGAEDWDVGDGAGERDGQRAVQSAWIESYIVDTWSTSREKCKWNVWAAVDLFTADRVKIKTGWISTYSLKYSQWQGIDK